MPDYDIAEDPFPGIPLVLKIEGTRVEYALVSPGYLSALETDITSRREYLAEEICSRNSRIILKGMSGSRSKKAMAEIQRDEEELKPFVEEYESITTPTGSFYAIPGSPLPVDTIIPPGIPMFGGVRYPSPSGRTNRFD